MIRRIGQLVELFRGRMDLWARMYDRDGSWRYAVHILHAVSDVAGTDDASFANGFRLVADEVKKRFHIPIGFTLDLINRPAQYVATPAAAGPHLELQPSVLAVHGFESEVFSGVVKNGPPCDAADWRDCRPYDNNVDNLEKIRDWKQRALCDWVRTDIPVILDVSNGMDGRIIWQKGGAGFWGDNLDYTDDRWRNWVSQLKGLGAKGITFDTWNGYTEGYAAVPSVEHGTTVYEWLTDLLEPDPRDFSHMQYVDGVPTYRVYGAICQRWVALGADRGFGAPTSDETALLHGRVSHFEGGKAICWSGQTGAWELHGAIAQTYWELSAADRERLGLPTSDEKPNGTGGQVSLFEHGRIDWQPGEDRGRVSYS